VSPLGAYLLGILTGLLAVVLGVVFAYNWVNRK
jgi:hypothetical protein